MNETTTPVRVEPNLRWVRGMIGGRHVVDSRRVRNVWEIPYYPAWYFPLDDIDAELVVTGTEVRSPEFGTASRYDVVVGDRRIADAAWRHIDCPVVELRDLVRFRWDAFDSWFEEDVEVFVHPRSPEVRVDALRSSRRVRVTIDGQVVADSTRPTILFETGLPPRYYLPKTDVRMDLLRPSETSTACPYKGFAAYWNVTIGETKHHDIAWGYVTPLPESAAVAGLVCFYDERVDVEVDGVPNQRPRTKFS